jgi:RNA recognition motif-containing protein
MNIFIGNLNFRLSEEELKQVFEEYGEVSSAKIITDKYSGKSKGFGFVEMNDDEQANAAIEALNGSSLGGRNINVNQARERSNDNRRDFNRRD